MRTKSQTKSRVKRQAKTKKVANGEWPARGRTEGRGTAVVQRSFSCVFFSCNISAFSGSAFCTMLLISKRKRVMGVPCQD